MNTSTLETKTRYQLTSHPVGSLREIWALSWPLMIGLISTGLMMFADRVLLSRHSAVELNALATSGMAYYLLLVLPMTVCAISEVLVGKLHGEGKLQSIGEAVWQMVWFAVALAPVFLLCARFLPHVLFFKSDNAFYETQYFQTLMSFGTFFCSAIAFSGFFIGTGKVRFVVYATLAANILNIVLGYLLIYGWESIPSLGIRGAALATGVSQIFQSVLLLIFFLKKQYRQQYGNGIARFVPIYLKEGLRIGVPAGLGKVTEVLSHFLFFRILMCAGPMHMTLVVLAGSFYIPISFTIEAISKGVSSIVANLLGAEQRKFLKKVFRSSILLHSIFFLFFSSLILSFPEKFLDCFLASENAHYVSNPEFFHLFYRCILFACLFYLVDGCAWILVGFLTAAGDTKYILYVSTLMNWVGYVVPTYFIVQTLHEGADWAWGLIAGYTSIVFLLYYWRYRSGKWLSHYTSL